ncbi:TPA: hypothetical protein HA244_02870 [Candidatus Micrarchaeota archaeon]|nr:hypothetical protein [Candidatus Micrarchaeota archaeon]
MEKTETTAIIAVSIIVFAGVFYFMTTGSHKNETLIENSLLVKSADPLGDIQKRLVEKRILVEQDLFASNDTRNSIITIMTSEVMRSLALQGKNATAYALVDGGENVCFGTECKGSRVVVRTGNCNCMMFNDLQVIIEGDEKFLTDQSVRTGRLIGFALSKTRVAS